MKAFRRIRYIFYVLLSILCVVALLPTEMVFFRVNPQYFLTELSEDWTVTTNETVEEDLGAGEVVPETVGRNDVIILTNRLPAEEVPAACMEVRTVRASLDVFLEDERIYSYGDPYGVTYINNKIHTIPLPKDYAGKRVSLLLRTNSDNAFSGLYPVAVGNRKDIFLRWVHENFRAIFYGSFLIIYGLFLMILAIFMFNAMSKDLRIMLSSVLVFLFGIYALAYYEIFEYFFHSPQANANLEMFSLYLLPAAVVGFLSAIRGGTAQRILQVLALGNVLLAVTFFTLHVTNIAHMDQTLSAFHLVVLLEGLAVLTILWIDISGGRAYRPARGSRLADRAFMRRADRILFLGVLAIILGGMADMIGYNLRAFRAITGTAYARIDTILIGVLVFAGGLLQNYFFYTVEHTNEAILNRNLAGVAYTDPLTGLANRTRSEQMLEQLEKEHADYSIMLFDVNDLKSVNDAHGHAEGDRLLRGFAALLKECFRGNDLIGRMGGDEFIVIMRDTPKSLCAQKETQLERIMERANRTEHTFQYSASCGYAHKNEKFGAASSDIFRLADDRMYEEKRRYHEEREAQGA